MNNSSRWKKFIKWWKDLDDTEYGDQYALIKAVSEKIKELKFGQRARISKHTTESTVTAKKCADPQTIRIKNHVP